MKKVYKATNTIDGKCYIGVDSNWPHRKHAHKSAAKKGSDRIFHKAIRKYGWDAFEWEILEESDDLEYLLNEREEYHIRQNNSYYLDGNGYNMTYGGEATLGWHPTEETKIKISKANKGREAWNKGMTSPWISKRNIESKGSISINRRKMYEFVDPEGNVFVEKGLKQFCLKHNLHAGNMASVAKGKLNHYKNWKCRLINK